MFLAEKSAKHKNDTDEYKQSYVHNTWTNSI